MRLNPEGPLAAVLLLLAQTAAAAVLPFSEATWQGMIEQRDRPRVLVFSTSDCVHCPQAIIAVAAALGSPPRRAELGVVMMDGDTRDTAWTATAHYRHAEAIYTFDGNPIRIRHRVNPAWRGLTPYVVLIPRRGEPEFHTGTPSANALRAFLARQGRRR